MCLPKLADWDATIRKTILTSSRGSPHLKKARHLLENWSSLPDALFADGTSDTKHSVKSLIKATDDDVRGGLKFMIASFNAAISAYLDSKPEGGSGRSQSKVAYLELLQRTIADCFQLDKLRIDGEKLQIQQKRDAELARVRDQKAAALRADISARMVPAPRRIPSPDEDPDDREAHDEVARQTAAILTAELREHFKKELQKLKDEGVSSHVIADIRVQLSLAYHDIKRSAHSDEPRIDELVRNVLHGGRNWVNAETTTEKAVRKISAGAAGLRNWVAGKE